MTIQENARFELTECTITNFAGLIADLSGLIQGFSVTESIYENVITGEMTMLDGVGLRMFLPFVGEETLTVAFKNIDAPGAEYRHTFRIYKMDDVTRAKEGPQGETYRLHRVSKEMVTNEQIRVSRSFVNQSITDIVSSLFLELKPESILETDDVFGTQHIVIGNKTPFQAINLLCTYAASPAGPSLYFFYEDKEGFKFKNIKNLFALPPKFSYTVRQQNQSDEVTNAIFNPLSYRQVVGFDMLDAVSRGMFANTVDAIDIVAKKKQRSGYRYNTEFSADTHIGGIGFPFVSSFFTDIKSQNYKLVPTSNLIQQSSYFRRNSMEGGAFGKTYEAYLPQRISLSQQIEYLESELIVPGNSLLKAGDIIDLTLPSRSNTEQSNVEKNDPYLTGNYIIKTLTHTLAGNNFITKLKLARDSYGQQIKSS